MQREIESRTGRKSAFNPSPTSVASVTGRSKSLGSPLLPKPTGLQIRGSDDSNLASRGGGLGAWPKTRDPRGVPPDFPLTATRVSVAIAATVLTWYAHASANPSRCGPVLASSAATLAASLVAPGLGQAAFCGSFAGMSSASLVPGWREALAVGTLSAALFEALIHARNAFLGLGGRLGLVAFVATNVAMMFRRVPAVATPTVSTAPIAVMTIAAAIGSAMTIAVRETSDDTAAADPVRAASVVGALAGLMVGTIPGFTDLAALAAYGGAFTGMSLPSRLLKGVVPAKQGQNAPQPQPGPLALLISFASAGALGGLFHALTIGWGWWSNPAGWGGKAGFCAFVGVVAFRIIAKASSVVLRRN
mmetsp:Transcript_11112/g.32936  ORF Transcript_11112/g.32936 Transcript_11112/m.32936 type:complete len:362 (-) Transcript_11112:176-1261(-)